VFLYIPLDIDKILLKNSL